MKLTVSFLVFCAALVGCTSDAFTGGDPADSGDGGQAADGSGDGGSKGDGDGDGATVGDPDSGKDSGATGTDSGAGTDSGGSCWTEPTDTVEHQCDLCVQQQCSGSWTTCTNDCGCTQAYTKWLQCIAHGNIADGGAASEAQCAPLLQQYATTFSGVCTTNLQNYCQSYCP